MDVPETVLLALLYIPGFLVFKFLEHSNNSSKKYDAYESTVFSLAITSLIGLCYILIKNLENLQSITSEKIIPSNFNLVYDLGIIVGITIVMAIILDYFFHGYLRFKRITRGDAWTSFFNEIYEIKGPIMFVYTSDGQVYRGILNFVSTRSDTKEISLLDPQRITGFNKKRKKILFESVGTEILFSSKDILRIIYQNPKIGRKE